MRRCTPPRSRWGSCWCTVAAGGLGWCFERVRHRPSSLRRPGPRTRSRCAAWRNSSRPRRRRRCSPPSATRPASRRATSHATASRCCVRSRSSSRRCRRRSVTTTRSPAGCGSTRSRWPMRRWGSGRGSSCRRMRRPRSASARSIAGPTRSSLPRCCTTSASRSPTWWSCSSATIPAPAAAGCRWPARCARSVPAGTACPSSMPASASTRPMPGWRQCCCSRSSRVTCCAGWAKTARCCRRCRPIWAARRRTDPSARSSSAPTATRSAATCCRGREPVSRRRAACR